MSPDVTRSDFDFAAAVFPLAAGGARAPALSPKLLGLLTLLLISP